MANEIRDFRVNAVASLLTVLTAYQTANPSLLRKVHRKHPGGFDGELPAAYIGRRDEDLSYTAQILTREFRNLEVVLVDEIGWDPAIPSDRLDALTDAILAAFNDAIQTQRPSGGILVPTGTRDDEIQATGQSGTVVHSAVRIIFGDAQAKGGWRS